MLTCPDCNPDEMAADRLSGETLISCLTCGGGLSHDDFSRIECPLCDRVSRVFDCRYCRHLGRGWAEAYVDESGECPSCGQTVTQSQKIGYEDILGSRSSADLIPTLREIRYAANVLPRFVLGVVGVAFLVSITVGILATIGWAIWSAVT